MNSMANKTKEQRYNETLDRIFEGYHESEKINKLTLEQLRASEDKQIYRLANSIFQLLKLKLK